MLEQEEIPDIDLRELFNEEADGGDINLSLFEGTDEELPYFGVQELFTELQAPTLAEEGAQHGKAGAQKISISPDVSAMAHVEANQDTTDIWSNLFDDSELVFNLLEQEEIYDSNLRELFNKEADGED